MAADTATDDTVELDGVQEQDADKTHPVLAAALLALLLSAHGGSDAPGIRRDWYGLVEASIGTAVISYLTRSALDLFDLTPGARAGARLALADRPIRPTARAVQRQTALQLATAARHLVGSASYRSDAAVSATRIAHSITTGGREQIRDRVARDIGATARVWRSRHDDAVRDTHAHLDGQVRPIGQPFDAGNGLTIGFPGDPSAPLSLTAGCRCHAAYRLGRLA